MEESSMHAVSRIGAACSRLIFQARRPASQNQRPLDWGDRRTRTFSRYSYKCCPRLTGRSDPFGAWLWRPSRSQAHRHDCADYDPVCWYVQDDSPIHQPTDEDHTTNKVESERTTFNSLLTCLRFLQKRGTRHP